MLRVKWFVKVSIHVTVAILSEGCVLQRQCFMLGDISILQANVLSSEHEGTGSSIETMVFTPENASHSLDLNQCIRLLVQPSGVCANTHIECKLRRYDSYWKFLVIVFCNR